ncbi:hypothetical protein B0A49_05183 [Cryomyces minteri]|uniref:Major facilitator superfamily (MFS) profile domain-containing protein n=1 Tax=Cryomyces minteri TaxID=331657 RepID=A0A4U0XCS7_9PEZI|nr:hypothetical protein B0A49_05183 [Cryomyces minteri]
MSSMPRAVLPNSSGDEASDDTAFAIDSEDKELEASVLEPAEVHRGHEKDIEQGSEMPLERDFADRNPVKRVITAQDWSGPRDPENPHNWSLLKRSYHTVPPALFGFTVTVASSIYTPAVPEIMKRFGVSQTAALLGLSLYVLGLGFGPALAAPISETHGRSIVYKTSLPMFMLFTLGAGYSQNFASLLVCRLFAGLTGAPVLAVGAGTNADLFPPHLRAVATSLFLLAPFAGPTLGPVIGGFAAQHKGWQWTMWCTLFIAVAAYLVSLGTHETYKKVILQRRARRLGIPPPPYNGPEGFGKVKFLVTVTLFRPVHMLFAEPIVGFLSLYTAFAFAVVFAFFAAFPLVFGGVYSFDSSQTGLTFLAIGTGICIAVPTAILLDRALYQPVYRQKMAQGLSIVAPEHRLYSAMVGSVGIPIGLFWFAWTARPGVHWAVPVVAAVPFAWGNLCVFISAALYLVDTYGPLNGASAMAANGIARYTLGAAFPLFTVQMYRRLGIAWATSLLGFVSLAMLPIPWVLYKWGPEIRRKSAYETIKA